MKTALTLLLAFCFASTATAADPTVELKVQHHSVNVTIDGQPFTTYHFGSDLPKPFFSPVRGPGGAVITRSLENPEDHPHHKGIWLSIDEVNGIKFWAEQGKIRNVSVKPVVGDGNPAKLEVVNHWLNPETNKPVLVETTTISIFPNRLLAYDISLAAANGPVHFEDTKEGLFGIRLTNSLREKETGHVVNAEGLKGTKEAWGKPSKWVDYYGEIDGKTYGAALFDHPENFRPSRYHVRNYGLFTISPFGEKSYTGGKGEAQPVTVTSGKPLRLRYGLYIHAGDTQQAEVGKVYEQFLSAAK